MKNYFLLLFIFSLSLFSCTDNDDTLQTPIEGPNLIVKFKFNPTQERLNNLGQSSTIPLGNAAQTPIFKKISSHFLEFSPSAYTRLGEGTRLYLGENTTVGGETAFNFSNAIIVSEEETFLSIPIKNIQPGSYEWARCSLSYQEYDIKVRSAGVDYTGTLGSFVGTRTYITTHSLGNYQFAVNGNRNQGYWAFGLQGFNYSTSGQTPAGATTVPNPLFATSEIPPNSCVVTGKFPTNLVITGNETKDIVVTLSLSINNSFEWHEVTPDGKYEPSIGENVVDMGLRGLIPSFTN